MSVVTLELINMWLYLRHRVHSNQLWGPIQPPIQRIPGEKRPGREADQSPPSSAMVKNAWDYTSTPQYLFMGLC
jgi:hypothetical protein